MLPNKSSNSGAIKGVEAGEASFSSPLVSLMKKNMKQSPSSGIMNYKLCLASLPPLVLPYLEARARPTSLVSSLPAATGQQPWLFQAELNLCPSPASFFWEGDFGENLLSFLLQ